MTKKKTEVQRLREKIQHLKECNEALERENNDLRDDLTRHRYHFEQYYKWFVRMLANGNTPDLKWSLRDMAQKLGRMKPWSWSAGE